MRRPGLIVQHWLRELFGVDQVALHEARTRIALNQQQEQIAQLLSQLNQTTYVVASEIRRLRYHETQSATLAHSSAKFEKMLQAEHDAHVAACRDEALAVDSARDGLTPSLRGGDGTCPARR